MNKANFVGGGIMIGSIIVLALIQFSSVDGVLIDFNKYFSSPVLILSIIAVIGLFLFFYEPKEKELKEK